MWSSARFKRSAKVLGLVVGGHPKIIEKLSHNFPATLDFLLVGGSFARNAYLALGLERNAIGARRFLCHGIHGFIGCLRMSSRYAVWNVSLRLAAAPAWPPLRPESAISNHRIYCNEVRTRCAASALIARADSEWPRGRGAAEQRDERAAFQLVELHSVPASQGRIAGYRIGEDQSGRNGTVLLGLLLGQDS